MSQPDWDKNTVTQVIDSLKDKPGAMLPILHGIQDTLGYIPKGCVQLIANALNVPAPRCMGSSRFIIISATLRRASTRFICAVPNPANP